MFAPVYVVLLHNPVINKRGEEVTTSVTNIDIHDIARTSRTYGAKTFFIVTPVPEQQELVGRILGHWKTARSSLNHPDRVNALSIAEVISSFEEAFEKISSEAGVAPEVIFTDAREMKNSVTYKEYRAVLESREEDARVSGKKPRPVFMVFGTGWGISESFFPKVDRFLYPVYGPDGKDGYNHLSVRAAVAAIMDRLFGT